jgi:DHA1 family inner membrane transport protein
LNVNEASFANVPPMQMRVMQYGKAAPGLAATANISAFNIANALGGLIGGAVVDSLFGTSAMPFLPQRSNPRSRSS